jgi:hypothetical protein
MSKYFGEKIMTFLYYEGKIIELINLVLNRAKAVISNSVFSTPI